MSAYEPAIAVEDRLDAEALGPPLALALAGLSRALRDVLVLHAWAELSHDEIAEADASAGRLAELRDAQLGVAGGTHTIGAADLTGFAHGYREGQR